jgi:hypothetical protein
MQTATADERMSETRYSHIDLRAERRMTSSAGANVSRASAPIHPSP